MPRWNLYYTAGLLSDEEKESLAVQVTKLYQSYGHPSFWTNVMFEEQPLKNYWAGGKSEHKAVFFYISHAARGFDSEEERLRFHETIDNIVGQSESEGTKMNRRADFRP